MENALTLALGAPLAIALGLGVPFLIGVLYHRMTVGLAFVLICFFMETVYLEFPGFQAGIYLYPGDIVFSLLLVAASFRLVFARDVPARPWIWLAFGAVLVVSFVMGLMQFGRTAGPDFRYFYFMWCSALYFATFPIDAARMRSIVRWWCFIAGALVLLATFRWIAEYLGLPIAASWRGAGEVAEFRVLVSNASLFLANTVLILSFLFATRTTSRWVWVGLPIVLLVVLVLQHRSVWIAMVVGFAIMYLVFPGRLRTRLARPLLAIALVAGVPLGAMVAYGQLDTMIEKLTSSANEVTSNRSTAGARMYGWGQLLGQMQPRDYVIGKPFGSGYERYEFPDVKWKADWDPHNFYLQTLLRSGLIGLALFLAAYLFAMPRLLKRDDIPDTVDLPPRLLFALLAMQLSYMMPYRAAYEQAIWLGLAMSMSAGYVASRRKRAVPAVATAAPAEPVPAPPAQVLWLRR